MLQSNPLHNQKKPCVKISFDLFLLQIHIFFCLGGALRKEPHIVCYRICVHKDRWIPAKGETLKAVVEPKNKEETICCCDHKDDYFVGQLSKEKTARFANIIFNFLRACDTNTQEGGKGMKVPCKLYFSAALVL